MPPSDVAEVARNIDRLDAELLRSAMVQVSDTLSVLPAPDDLSQALEVKPAHVEAIVKQARQMFDFVVLDVGRSIDAVSAAGAGPGRRASSRCVQLSLPQVRDAKRLRDLFRSLEYPAQKIHWLVNRHQKGGEITLESLEQTLGIEGHHDDPEPLQRRERLGEPGRADRASWRATARSPRRCTSCAQSIAPADGRQEGQRWLSSLFAALTQLTSSIGKTP